MTSEKLFINILNTFVTIALFTIWIPAYTVGYFYQNESFKQGLLLAGLISFGYFMCWLLLGIFIGGIFEMISDTYYEKGVKSIIIKPNTTINIPPPAYVETPV